MCACVHITFIDETLFYYNDTWFIGHNCVVFLTAIYESSNLNVIIKLMDLYIWHLVRME